MRFERLKNVAILIALYAICLTFFAVDGCSTGGPIGTVPATGAATRPSGQPAAPPALIEAEQALAAGQMIAIDLHTAGVISDATFGESQGYLIAAQKSLDAVTAGGSGDYLLAVADAWAAIDAAAAVHSPAAPPPSTRRKH